MNYYGLIGKSLSHSFSKSYFEKKFTLLNLPDHQYLNIELENITDFKKAISDINELKGLNVTVPYKESIIPYLNDVSDEAKQIGAVNCIKVSGGKLIGYNTDVYGFSQSIKPFLDTNHERALILGTGGASKAVAFALRKIGVEVYFITSTENKINENTFTYSDINERMMTACKLIVNTTPVGTMPDIDNCPPLPYHLFTKEHLAFDLIYNPPETLFLEQARHQGSITVNGWSMLQLQAEKSWEIWNT